MRHMVEILNQQYRVISHSGTTSPIKLKTGNPSLYQQLINLPIVDNDDPDNLTPAVRAFLDAAEGYIKGELQ